MTASELKAKVEARGTASHFFTRETMKFFGDTMRNYGVRETVIDTWSDNNVEVYELYRRRPVKHGLWSSAYFRKDTLEAAHKKAGG
jgi:hypothetical protein